MESNHINMWLIDKNWMLKLDKTWIPINKIHNDNEIKKKQECMVNYSALVYLEDKR
jgi:hypothetical protein